MKKIIYTTLSGGVNIVIPTPKEILEKTVGPLLETEYEALVMDRSIKADAINVRPIEDFDIPISREFREAWVDTEPGSQIDINCDKAKDIELGRLRSKRNKLLEETDTAFLIALEQGLPLEDIKAEKQRLRDVTGPLKALDTINKVNDVILLNKIRDLGAIL